MNIIFFGSAGDIGSRATAEAERPAHTGACFTVGY